VFLDHFDVLLSKIILKNKKIYYFDVFRNKKYFKKQLSSYSQTPHRLLEEKIFNSFTLILIRTIGLITISIEEKKAHILDHPEAG